MEPLLEQPTRRRIFDVVCAHPGASAREIQRYADLGWGETAYHLDQLTQAGVLRRERGGHRDYYFPGQMTWEDRRLFQALRRPAQRHILVALVDRPNLTLAEIAPAAGLGLSTASFHLRHLLAAATVEGTVAGNVRRYRALQPDRVRQLLHQYRTSFADSWIDRFVEAWSGMLEG
ncbi:transcriptional regulator, ArsR family protein [mine drainage metagenome]|uniref:Transcriptional regulator, ArsR family protein n=1 Tax=mine drainage metagenome TaxID=410659 RepID=T0YDL2_9ZZZZ